jgi:hypothetical protein
MEYKVLVIIQGPIVSSGWNSGSGKRVSDFNTLNYIRRYYETKWRWSYKFVVSTWDTTDFFDFPESFDVVQNSDPGPIRCINSISKTNDYRQALSTFNGLERHKLDLPNFRYCIKVRTDQFVDIDSLVDHMESHISSMQINPDEAPIFFPNALQWSPYSVGDFFIGSTPLQLYKFFSSQVKFSDIQCSDFLPWTHSEIIFRYLLDCHKDILPRGVPRIGFDIRVHPRAIRNSKIPCNILRAAYFLHKDLIAPFKEESTAKLEWRGEAYDLQKHSNGIFYEEWIKHKDNFDDYVVGLYPDRFMKSKMSAMQNFIFFQKDALWLRRSKYLLAMIFFVKFFRDIAALKIGFMPMSNIYEKLRDMIDAA